MELPGKLSNLDKKSTKSKVKSNFWKFRKIVYVITWTIKEKV